MPCYWTCHQNHHHVVPLALISIFTNPSARAGYDTRSIFRRSLTGLNSEFSFSKTSCLTKAEEPSLSYYLPIAGGRIIGFIPFPRVLVLCEMQLASYRIWTRVTVPISNDGNHYTTDTLARISLTLSSLSFIASSRSSGLHPVSSHSWWIYVRAGRPAFRRPYVGVTEHVFQI